MVRVKSQHLSVWVFFLNTKVDKEPSAVTGNPGVQERECPFHLCLNGELDGRFNRVQVVVELLNLFLG